MRNRCRERLERLATGSLDPEEARRAAIDELRRAVGFDRWCWPLTDPGSGLATGGIAEFDIWPTLPRLVALQEDGDVMSKPRLIAGPRPSQALSGATAGDLARSRFWRECLHPYGIGDTVMTVCRDRHGCWGSFELMRDSGDAAFDEDEVGFLAELAPILATLLRRSLVRSWQDERGGAGARLPGTLILDGDLAAAGWTSPMRDWLLDLQATDGMLPPAVYEIGARLLAAPAAGHGRPARVRIRASSGRWAVIEGAPLEGSEDARVAITIRDATADEVADVLCKAHDLTPRERQLVLFLRGGLATRQLSAALRISPYTVQDHLKAIFDKTGVRSRRELISHLAGCAPAAARAADARPASRAGRPAPAGG